MNRHIDEHLSKYMTKRIIHFELSPSDGDCYKRAIEVRCVERGPAQKRAAGGAEGSSRKL